MSRSLIYLLLAFLLVVTLIADDLSSVDEENFDDDDNNDEWRVARRRWRRPRRRWRRPVRRVWRRPVRRITRRPVRRVRRPRRTVTRRRRPRRVTRRKPARTMSSPVKKHAGMCYKRSYGRGVGRVLKCDPRGSHKHYQAGLCYKGCPRGWRGVGPVCWPDCPRGFRDHGAFCRKARRTYGRGIGIIGKGNCQRKYRRSCENHWGLWYQKCRAGYVPHGCCICSQTCPRGFRDIGISCAKPSRGRGVGRIPTSCKPYGNGWEKSGLICYPKCKKNFYGVGPVCWHDCKAMGKKNCGAMCADSTPQCAKDIANKVFNTLKVVAQAIASKGSSLLKGGIVKLVETYNYPICGDATSKTVSQVVGVLAKGAGFLAGKLGKNDDDLMNLDDEDRLELIQSAFDVRKTFDDDILQSWDESNQNQLQNLINDESNYID